MDDLKLIKKHYGEKMAHFCRESFPTLLETPGLLFGLISSKFAYTKCLFEDINTELHHTNYKKIFIDYINNLVEANKQKEEEEKKEDRTPYELLREAGYTLYECKTEKDIQSFKKYYKENERLCTFKGKRLDSCYVFFAVKDNADKLDRASFNGKEDRQDEYGTSVISIQFARGKNNFVSIKNRYNHTVYNPDCTFNNNLDNIIPGLTKAFEKEYNLSTSYEERKYDADFPGYFLASDNKYHKYYLEKDTVYYCPDNKIIDTSVEDSVFELDKSQYIVFDTFILDLKRKMFFQYNGDRYYHDSFVDGLQDIKTIEVKTNKETKKKTIIINDDIKIVIDEFSRMIEYENPHITEIGNNFLDYYTKLKRVSLPNVEKVGKYFLHSSSSLESIYMPKVKSFDSNCLTWSEKLKTLNLPNVETIGDNFIAERYSELKTINAPKLKKVSSHFLNWAKVKYLNIPNIREVGSEFLCECVAKDLYLPNLEKAGIETFAYSTIENLKLPGLKKIDSNFLSNNVVLKSIDVPNLEVIGHGFLKENTELTSISLPKAKIIGDCVLTRNKTLYKLSLPECKRIGDHFLSDNKTISKLYLPNVENIGNYFLRCDYSLKKFNAPKLKSIGFGSGISKYNVTTPRRKGKKEVEEPPKKKLLSRFAFITH